MIPFFPSLDNVGHNCTHASRKRRRCFHRVISGLEKDPRCRFLTLTSSPKAKNPIQKDLRRLFERLRRRGLLTDYIRVIEMTKQGRQHAHIIYRGDYINQMWISKMWEKIHQSPVVDIRSVKQTGRGKRRAAAYLAKYMAKEGAHKYSWSWGWVYKGFVKTWMAAKRLYRQAASWTPQTPDFAHFLHLWQTHIRGREPPEQFLAFCADIAYNTPVGYRNT
ncbi:hypothetical protein ES705_29753 [subsurface metagenome]